MSIWSPTTFTRAAQEAASQEDDQQQQPQPTPKAVVPTQKGEPAVYQPPLPAERPPDVRETRPISSDPRLDLMRSLGRFDPLLAAVENLNSDPELRNELSTILKGVGIELGVQTFGQLLYYKKYGDYLKTLKHLHKGSRLARVGGPKGLLTSLFVEGAIGASGNYLNQKYLEARIPNYRDGEGVSVGEVLAAGVFNLSPLTDVVGVLKLTDKSIQSLKGWGVGRRLMVKGTEQFVQGAVLGTAEEFLRVSLEEVLDGEDNAKFNILLTAGGGGLFQTTLSGLLGSGQWGISKIRKITGNANTKIQSEIDKITAELKEYSQDLPEEYSQDLPQAKGIVLTGFPNTGKPEEYSPNVRKNIFILEQQLRTLKGAQQAIKETEQTLLDANKEVSKQQAKFASEDPTHKSWDPMSDILRHKGALEKTIGKKVTVAGTDWYFYGTLPSKLNGLIDNRVHLQRTIEYLRQEKPENWEGILKKVEDDIEKLNAQIKPYEEFKRNYPAFWDIAVGEREQLPTEAFGKRIERMPETPSVRATQADVDSGLASEVDEVLEKTEDPFGRFNGTEVARLVEEGYGTSVSNILDVIEKNTKSTYLKNFSKLIRNLAEGEDLQNMPIFLMPDNWESTTSGMYDSVNKDFFQPGGVLYINLGKGDNPVTVIHELIHGLTIRKLSSTIGDSLTTPKPGSFYDGLQDIFGVDAIQNKRRVRQQGQIGIEDLTFKPTETRINSLEQDSINIGKLDEIGDHDAIMARLGKKREELLDDPDQPEEVKAIVDTYFEYLFRKTQEPAADALLTRIDPITRKIFGDARQTGKLKKDTLHIEEVLAQYPAINIEEFLSGLSDASFVNELKNMPASARFSKGNKNITLLDQFLDAIRKLFPKLNKEQVTLYEQALQGFAGLSKMNKAEAGSPTGKRFRSDHVSRSVQSLLDFTRKSPDAFKVRPDTASRTLEEQFENNRDSIGEWGQATLVKEEGRDAWNLTLPPKVDPNSMLDPEERVIQITEISKIGLRAKKEMPSTNASAADSIFYGQYEELLNLDAIPDDTKFLQIEAGKADQGGTGVYQLLLQHAVNNNLIYTPATAITDINYTRLTGAMLSSALKNQTTKHIIPHPSHLRAMQELGVIGDNYRWGENFEQDINALAKLEASNINPSLNRGKNLNNVKIEDFSQQDGKIFYEGVEKSDEELTEILKEIDPKFRETGVGVGTLKRAILTQALDKGEELGETGERFSGAFASPNVMEEAFVPPVEIRNRERNVDGAREDKLDELIIRTKRIETDPSKGNLSTEGAQIHREAKKVSDETETRITEMIRLLTQDPDNLDVVDGLLREIRFKRDFNKNITDWWNTTGGRLVQSQRGDADIFEWSNKYSERAQRQDEALSRLQATLEARTRGVKDDDDIEIQKIFNEYLDTPDAVKADRARPREDLDVEDALLENRLSDDVDLDEQSTDIAEAKLKTRKEKLEKRLKELQERFGDPSKITEKQTKEIQEDPEIADLKQRIKFYTEAEKEFLQIKFLEQELAKVAKLDVAPLGEQRAAITPKPTGRPKKASDKAKDLRRRIAKVKDNIKNRINEIDTAQREIKEGFEATKAEKALDNKIIKLQSELDELRASFGKEPEAEAPTAKAEKDPRVKDLEDRIKFYKEAQSDVKKIKSLEEERARLLGIETGPLGKQREEVTPKPTGPKKASGKIEELNKDIAFLRRNMRNRIKEIDRARLEMSEEFRAEQLQKAYEKKRTKLESELEGLRNRFGKIDEEAKAAGLDLKPKKDPRLKELEEKIKYYKEAEKEALNVLKLERKLARVADIEGRGIVGELRKETTPTPKGPVKPARSAMLRKKIQESKNRMKQKLRDLDNAQKDIEDAQLRARMFKEIEESFYQQLEADNFGMMTKGWMFLKSMRRMALIDQLPSVLAGVPTGMGAVAKQFFRGVTRFFYNPENYKMSLRARMALADVTGAVKIITDTKGLWAEARRTFAENRSAVDQRAGSISNEYGRTLIPEGESALVARAYASAKRRAEALENTSNWFLRVLTNGNYMQILSLGVRGIQTVDSVFKRQIIRGRIYAQAQKQALVEFPDNPNKAKKRAEELYASAWRDSDGLAVLQDKTVFDDDINQIREELLFAAHGDLEDYHLNWSEKLINIARERVNDGGFLGNTVDAIMPFIGVPIRSVYRGGKLAFSPMQVLAQGGLSKVPGLKARINPYSQKIREMDRLLKGEYELLRKVEPDSDKAEGARERIRELTERKKRAEERRIKYNEELLTDSMVATSLYFLGGTAALYHGATGSLEWMTDDQRKNNKLESFKLFGMDYSAALPWSFPIAMAADVASWARIKREERETGRTILTKDQTLPFVISASFKKLAEAMPLAQGIQTAEDIARLEGEVTRSAIARLVSSYVPLPAQARKIIQTTTQDGVADLRGGSYWDRIGYSVLGLGVTNLKTDRLGEDIQSTANWTTNNIMRQLPRDQVVRTEFDKVVATDTHGNLSGKPVSLTTGIKMTEWTDEDGMTLSYAYDQRLKKKRVKIPSSLKAKGLTAKTLDIKSAVNSLIGSPEWRRKFQGGFQEDEATGRFINEGLAQLNDLLNLYYRETKKDILKDYTFLNTFVNENDESLYDVINQRGRSTQPIGEPVSPLELLAP